MFPAKRFFISVCVCLWSLSAMSADAEKLVGSYAGTTPPFLKVFNKKPCSLKIEKGEEAGSYKVTYTHPKLSEPYVMATTASRFGESYENGYYLVGQDLPGTGVAITGYLATNEDESSVRAFDLASRPAFGEASEFACLDMGRSEP